LRHFSPKSMNNVSLLRSNRVSQRPIIIIPSKERKVTSLIKPGSFGRFRLGYSAESFSVLSDRGRCTQKQNGTVQGVTWVCGRSSWMVVWLNGVVLVVGEGLTKCSQENFVSKMINEW
jgi:hypothetical protein